MQHHSSQHPFPPPLLMFMRNSPQTFPDCSIYLHFIGWSKCRRRDQFIPVCLPVVYDDDVQPRPPHVLPEKQMLSVLQNILSPLSNKDLVPSCLTALRLKRGGTHPCLTCRCPRRADLSSPTPSLLLNTPSSCAAPPSLFGIVVKTSLPTWLRTEPVLQHYIIYR